MIPKTEILRRLRLGDLCRLFRSRYGLVLPDDDAGRADLNDLLTIISLGANADIKMAAAADLWAPWMPGTEAQEAIDYINRTPIEARRLSPEELGRRHMVTQGQRERLGLRQIWPVDMDVDQMKAFRKAKANQRKRDKRRKAGAKPRAEYEADSINRTKPWLEAGVSRRTWYRKRGTSLSEGHAGCAISAVSQYIGSWGWL
jgi:hypothetical protein